MGSLEKIGAMQGRSAKSFALPSRMWGSPYFNPHWVRKTLVSLGQSLCRTPEELKAWSQNLGHEGVLTTLRSYGTVTRDRQAQIMASLRHAENANLPRLDPQARQVLERLLRA